MICIEELVFECNAQPLSDECATTSPLREPDGTVPVWISRTETANPVDPPTLGDAIECTDWSTYSKGSSEAEINFYKFGLGDYACDNGRVFVCVEECNMSPLPDDCWSQGCTWIQPGTSQENSWTLLRNPATPVTPVVPPQVECYTYTTAASVRLWLPGDIVCISDLLFECPDLLEGLDCVADSPTQTDTVWSPITESSFPVPVTTPASVNATCYDWTQTAPAASGYSFVSGDKACDANRVWTCSNAALCQTTQPSLQTGAIWALTTDYPVSVTPPVIVDCFIFALNFNYLPGDLVCVEEAVY